MPNHLDFNLNDNQYDAVHHFDSPVIVLAGPGSGKTRVIVHRMAELILNRGIDPESIVALTFTNKAAEEMRKRLAELLRSSAKAERVIACTFHSFGLRLIRQFADLAGLRPEPTIIDEGQQRALMRTVIDEAGVSVRETPFDPYAGIADGLRFIGVCRNQALFPEDVEAHATNWAARLAAGEFAETDPDAEAQLAELTKQRQFQNRVDLYRRFEEACYERGWVTFDDLQAQTLRLLRTDERIRAIVRSDYRHLVVDEFQDVNRAQIELLKCLAGPTHDLCVVGDDDQAIYGFRGSIAGGFRHVVEHWPKTQTIELTQNYRSSAVIVEASDRIITKCGDRFKPDKELVAAGVNAACGLALEGVTYAGKEGAGPIIGRMILDYVSNGELCYGDCAVLVRTNTELGRVASALQALEIPVDVPELGSVAADPVVQDILSWLRVLSNPNEKSHLLRLLARPPFAIEMLTVVGWADDYRKQLGEIAKWAKDAEGEGEVEVPAHLQSFGAFLSQGKAGAHRSMARFTELYNALAIRATTESADALTLAVIRATGVLALDPVNPTAHQERVEKVGRFLGFVRERLPMLEAPRQVGQFLRYYDDLVAARVPIELGQTPADRMDDGVALARLDAVRILTAHKSKGLEFDTVFIPQVNSPNGYPMKPGGAKSGPLVPDDLMLDGTPSADDDERRVFFVALTRAEKRAVLLAMTKQDNGRNKNPSQYWLDLLEPDTEPGEHGAGQPLRVRADHEVMAEINSRCLESGEAAATDFDLPGLGDADDGDGSDGVRMIREREQFQIRHRVYDILHALREGDLDGAAIDRLQDELRMATLRLPILAAETPGALATILEELPADCKNELAEYAKDLVAREPWYDLLAAPQGPLQLSFSDVELYLRCPRCFWLRKVVGLREQSTVGANLGSIVHRTLEFFYKRWQQHEDDPELMAQPTLETLLQLGREAYRDMLPPDEAWTPKFERQIEEALRHYWDELHDDSANPIYLEQSVVFDFESNGQTHKIRVRMDRIDADEMGHHVIDYKTGKPTKAKLEPKSTDLQLGVYLLALRAFLEDDEPAGSAAYWLLQNGERGVIDFEAIKLDKINAKIEKAIDGILTGVWDRKPGCKYCELLAESWSESAAQTEADISA